jgi:hypothetical protein
LTLSPSRDRWRLIHRRGPGRRITGRFGGQSPLRKEEEEEEKENKKKMRV